MAGIAGQPSAKPSSIKSPVPNEDLAAAASAFVAQQGNQMPQAPAGSPDQAAEPDLATAAQQFAGGGQAEAAPQGPGIVSQGLDYAGRGLDYMGGVMRTGVANSAGMLKAAAEGKNPLAPENMIVKPEDLKAATYGKAPSSAEYLKRMGFGEGKSISLPFVGKISERDVEGLALDIATDPLTIFAKTLKEIPYIGKLLKAPGQAAEALGDMTYKSGLSKVDAKLAERGKGPVSEILKEEGKVGTTAKLAKDVDDLANSMGKIRGELYDRVNQAGVQVDLSKGFSRTEAVIDKLRRDPTPHNIALANEFEEMLNGYKNRGTAPIDLVSEWKTSYYDALPKSAFNPANKLTGVGKQFKGALAEDLRQSIIQTGEKADKGLGHAIDKVNNKWGILIEAKNPMKKQANQAAAKSFLDKLDFVLAAADHSGGLALAKKGAEALNTTVAKTVMGKAMMEAGKRGVADALTRQAVIHANRPGQPPASIALPQAPEEPAAPPEEEQ
jgi:hypothetical protein